MLFISMWKKQYTVYIMYKPCKLVGYISYRIIYHLSRLFPGYNPSQVARPPGQLMDPALLFRMRVLLKEACHAEVPHPGREDCLVQNQQIYEILCKNSGYLLGIYQL